MKLVPYGSLILLLAVLAMLAEAFFYRRIRGRAYDWREALASLGVATGQRALRGLTGGLVLGLAAGVWEYRVGTIPMDRPLSWVALFLLNEFTYYWTHRLSHEVRWLWMAHSVHHTAHQLALSAAYRLGWAGPLSGSFLFWLPLIWLGFPPPAVFAMLGLNLVYQFWLHTELVPRLPLLDRLLNTPSNHRVHHARNEEYLDKNFGGVIMWFDKLFGTYAEERRGVEIVYGVVNRPRSLNPFRLALAEVVNVMRDVGRARSLREVVSAAFGRPHG